MICEFLFSFLTNSRLSSGIFGKSLLSSARPRCRTLGKSACCLFCGDRQQRSLRRLKAKWKIPHGWFSHFLFSQNHHLGIQFPNSGATSTSEILCPPNWRSSSEHWQLGHYPKLQAHALLFPLSTFCHSAFSKDLLQENMFPGVSISVDSYHLLLLSK